MTDTHNPAGDSDREERRQEIIAHLESLGPEKAHKQLGILPYYHAIENAVTKPNQGTFVTRYFRTMWRPALGNEASEIVLAVRFCADKETGETFAGYDTIADIAGLSVRCVERWLSHYPPKNRSKNWLEQWRLLHTFFILGKKKRYPEVMVGNRLERRRTTNIMRIAMDDPVHPDHQGQLFVLAAERIIEEEQKSVQTREIPRNRPVDGYGPAPYAVTVEKSLRNRPVDGYLAPTSGRSVSLPYRMNNVSTFGHAHTKTGPKLGSLARDPRVVALTPEQRGERERTADLIDQTIKKLEGDRTTGQHRSAGFHRKVALLMDPTLVREALAATQDAMQRERRGEHTVHKGPAAYFGGAVLQIALKEGIDLGMGQPAAERRIEALASPRRTTPAALAATSGASAAETDDNTPEARARIYADHLFPFHYRMENSGREPSKVEQQAAYERRLEELQRNGPNP